MVKELIKSFRKEDTQITSLTAKLENIAGKVLIDIITDFLKTQVEEGSTSTTKAKGDIQMTINSPISITQLKELIKELVKDQVETSTQFCYTYAKLYT